MEENRSIRISKVLKEINLSLVKAVDYLKNIGINIEFSPNAKISLNEYEVLYNEFGNENKPFSIIKLEIIFLITLREVNSENMFGWDYKKTYLLNEKKEVIGLNLCLSGIENISFLKSFKELLFLDLSNNEIKDFSPLEGLVKVEKLALDASNLKSLSSLIELKHLKLLSIAQNNLDDYSDILKFDKLETLTLQNNGLKSIEFLENLKNIKNLDLSFNEIEDILVLKSLVNLEELLLSLNKIDNFNVLSSLNKLIRLEIGGCKIEDISFLEDLKIEALTIGENPIKDYSVLKTLKNLNELRITHSNLTDVSFLKDLKKIIYLHLSDNNIEEVSLLYLLKELKFIDISRNKINEINEFQFILNKPDLFIYANSNPCFEENNIILNRNINHYPIIVNELKKDEDDQVDGRLPEKILLLGNHSSGKSSLLHYLQNDDLDFKEDSTHILKIENYPLNYQYLPKAIVYDFGGQDFYHGIYNAFLTVNSITLLFWNTETDINGMLLDSSKRHNINYNLDYWLGQRKSNEYNGELLVVQTHSDDKKSKRKSYINDCNPEGEFYVSLKKESSNEFKNNLKHKTLELLKLTIDEIIDKKQFSKNLSGKISIHSYNLLKHILNSEDTHEPVQKNSLKKYYKTKERGRFETELEQLYLQGLVLIHNDNVWLKPMALASYFHNEILKKKLIGKGVISKTNFNTTISNPIRDLLIDQKVIFYDSTEKKYIIPNYLPLTSEDEKIYELLTFDHNQPNFILKFKNFIPFGLINQLVCYYGKNEGVKYYWRDQLIFKTNDNRFRVLIKLDYSNLEISVSIKSIELNINTSEIERDVFSNILDLYWGDTTSKINIEDLVNGKIEVTISYANKKQEEYYISPDDLYLSVDGKTFIHHKTLENRNKTKLKINSFTLTHERELDLNNVVEQSSGVYKNFTKNIQIKEMKKIFISYSKYDDKYKKEFVKHLISLKDENLVDPFNCDEIDLGDNSHEVIQKKLTECDYMIALVSVDFLNTEYIRTFEIDKAIELGKKIIPIIIKPCDWESSKLGKFHATLRGTNISLDSTLFLDGQLKETSEIERQANWVKIIKEFRAKLFNN